ncbi:hypothetical protein [Desulfobulbus propionicus]|jgi:hypothetical protein
MQPDSAYSLVRTRLKELKEKLINEDNISKLVIYENHLNYYAKRFVDPTIRSELSILDPQKFEATLAVDPSRFDQLLGLALYHFYYGQRTVARHLLQKIASSRFHEAKTAQRLLESLVNKSLK